MDGLTLFEVAELQGYWNEHPPVHEILRTLGQYFGAWDGPRKAAGAAASSEAEIAGFVNAFHAAAKGLPH